MLKAGIENQLRLAGLATAPSQSVAGRALMAADQRVWHNNVALMESKFVDLRPYAKFQAELWPGFSLRTDALGKEREFFHLAYGDESASPDLKARGGFDK